MFGLEQITSVTFDKNTKNWLQLIRDTVQEVDAEEGGGHEIWINPANPDFPKDYKYKT